MVQRRVILFILTIHKKCKITKIVQGLFTAIIIMIIIIIIIIIINIMKMIIKMILIMITLMEMIVILMISLSIAKPLHSFQDHGPDETG